MVLVVASVQAAAGDQEILSLRGRVIVDVVDAQRVIVAVDSNKDGKVEHLFLYSASERMHVSPQLDIPGEVQYREGDFLLVKLAGGVPNLWFSARQESGASDSDASVIRFDRTAGLSQYIPVAPISIEDLKSKRITGDCAMTPASCVEVSGQLLPFSA
jgi:hypothetical protein